MKNKLTALLLALLVFSGSAVSCGKNETVNENESNETVNNTDTVQNTGNDVEKDKSEEKTDSEKNTENPPSDSKDKADTPDKSDDSENTDDKEEYVPVYLAKAPGGYELDYAIDGSEYSIFTTADGQSYGIIDINGNVAVKPEYSLLGWCGEHKVIYAEPFKEGDAPVILSENYKIDMHYGHGGWGEDYLLFDNSSGKMFSFYFDIDAVYVSEVTTLSINTPYINYTGDAEFTEGDFTMGGEDGIYDTLNELITADAEYEFITEKGSIVNLGECRYTDGFVNGYMAVLKNGFYGFVDGLGKAASEFIYDDVTTAYDGKAWVKKGGEWKVLVLN